MQLYGREKRMMKRDSSRPYAWSGKTCGPAGGVVGDTAVCAKECAWDNVQLDQLRVQRECRQRPGNVRHEPRRVQPLHRVCEQHQGVHKRSSNLFAKQKR